MISFILPFLVLLLPWDGSCQSVSENLRVFNQELHFLQHLEAESAWNFSLGINTTSLGALGDLAISKHLWNSNWCKQLMFQVYGLPILETEARQIYLFCRGPEFTAPQLRQVIALLTRMQEIYGTKKVFSMKMEPELNKFMETTRDEGALRSAWIEWFRGIGTEVKPIYEHLVPLLNAGARSAGRQDMGVIWREEMETPALKGLALKLYSEVKDLYALLHSVVRYKLGTFYKIKLDKTIPAHILGNMWAQKWDSLLDIIFPVESVSKSQLEPNPLVRDLVMKEKVNVSALDVVHVAENFFTSMGFPPLPQKFYSNSYFTEDDSLPSKNCHGTAANMYGDAGIGDYRMMMCIPRENITDEDLLTLTHEMGHIYYFMAYSKLEPIFQDGANAAFHESVGDSITYGLKSGGKSIEEEMRDLVRIALAKLPQIGFGLIMDLWRWYVFEHESSPETWNAYWWQLNYDFLGISPPEGYTTDGLDAAGKYHVMENIPYIRYFLASFLQLQFFQSFCEDYEEIHDCQLRGNKKAGQKLWKMMEKGSSEHWSVVLKEMTGSSEVLSQPLLRFFEPVRAWLGNEILKNNLTVGW